MILKLVLLFGKRPSVVENATSVPVCTGFPELSTIIAVIVEELPPSAGMDVGVATNVIDAVGAVLNPVHPLRPRRKAEVQTC